MIYDNSGHFNKHFKKWALNISVVLNLAFFFYIFAQMTSKNDGVDIFDKLQTSFNRRYVTNWKELGKDLGAAESTKPSSQKESTTHPAKPTTAVTFTTNSNYSKSVIIGNTSRTTGAQLQASAKEDENIGGEVKTGGGKVDKTDVRSGTDADRMRALQQLTACHDRDAQSYTAQRGDFWVLYNYVAAERRPHCWESITYTTHADYTFLDNLQPLLDRWRGPVSLALYAPGTDFAQTLNTIRYLRHCGSEYIRYFVTFHIYFPMQHMPDQIPRGDRILQAGEVNCSLPAPWVNQNGDSYKNRNKLLYMVNVGRNIARETATTHYVLASDIELYPSPGVIPKFFDMLLRQEPALQRKNPRVFVLPLFEIKSNMLLPEDKKELMKMLKNGSAITFHKFVCPTCHAVPRSDEWIRTPPSADNSLKVFHIGKRTGSWEPIYIGTNREPFYEERLSWEGKGDKMTQGYILCVYDYDLLVLDNAFLVHKPGIKVHIHDPVRELLVTKNYALIKNVIYPEMELLFGTRQGCSVMR